MILSVFCMPGGHAVKFDVGDDIDAAMEPPGWTMVEAACIPAPTGPDDPWSPGIWYAQQGTGCYVLCCPDHPLIDIKETP